MKRRRFGILGAVAGAMALVLAVGLLAGKPARAHEASPSLDPAVAQALAEDVDGLVGWWAQPLEGAEQQAEEDAGAQQEPAAEAAAETAGASTEEAASSAGQTVAEASDAEPDAEPADVWHVSYVSSYGSSSAPDDGSVGEWADGYFIAHDWSANGERIAACPTYVEVDGQLYRFVGSTTFTRDTYYEDGPEQFTHADGGIGFQTCYGSVYLVTHYVPC